MIFTQFAMTLWQLTSDFALEVAKYPKSSPKPQNCVRAYCLAPLAMQLVHVYEILTTSIKDVLATSGGHSVAHMATLLVDSTSRTVFKLNS